MFRPFNLKVSINVYGDKLSLTRFVYNVHFSIGLQQAQKTAWWLEYTIGRLYFSVWMCTDDIVVVVINPPSPKLVMCITGNI